MAYSTWKKHMESQAPGRRPPAIEVVARYRYLAEQHLLNVASACIDCGVPFEDLKEVDPGALRFRSPGHEFQGVSLERAQPKQQAFWRDRGHSSTRVNTKGKSRQSRNRRGYSPLRYWLRSRVISVIIRCLWEQVQYKQVVSRKDLSDFQVITVNQHSTPYR